VRRVLTLPGRRPAWMAHRPDGTPVVRRTRREAREESRVSTPSFHPGQQVVHVIGEDQFGERLVEARIIRIDRDGSLVLHTMDHRRHTIKCRPDRVRPVR
jgi:limonene-1,2-epoxide hydrolase